MTLEVEVVADPRAATARVAGLIVDRARAALEKRGAFSVALSRAPPELVAALDLPWDETTVYQVDERIAPAGHADRNLTALLAGLPDAARDAVHPMPVETHDLEDGAARYAAGLPPLLDLVHLGLGSDGHTASLVPGDPVLDVDDRLVAVTGAYQGLRRMTLTYPALDAARELVWLVTGGGKRAALARLLARDESIPAARVSNPGQLVVTDAAAVPSQ